MIQGFVVLNPVAPRKAEIVCLLSAIGLKRLKLLPKYS